MIFISSFLSFSVVFEVTGIIEDTGLSVTVTKNVTFFLSLGTLYLNSFPRLIGSPVFSSIYQFILRSVNCLISPSRSTVIVSTSSFLSFSGPVIFILPCGVGSSITVISIDVCLVII